jgi:hypothetical protein
MSRRPNALTIAVLAAAALVAVLATTAALAESVSWSAKRPLSWDDFRGSVPHSTAPYNVAMTAAALRWSYDYSVRRAGEGCSYRVTQIRIEALFDPATSWVKAGHRTDAVLAHEQGHFDLAEVHRLMFEQASHGRLRTDGRCRGRNAKSIGKFVEREIEATLGRLYERTWRNFERIQSRYDEETAHGMNAAAQSEWLATIAAALGGRGWNALGFDDAR